MSNVAGGSVHPEAKAIYPSKQKAEEQTEQRETLVKQDPSQTTGLQWAQAASAQASEQVQPTESTRKSSQPEIMPPDIEDFVTLSTTVSTKEESVEAPQRSLNPLASKFDVEAFKGKFAKNYEKSKSHNLLLERCVATMKVSGGKMLLSLLGVSAEEQAAIQAEVRENALQEIDTKLKNEVAYTSAMVKITMG